MSPFFADCGRNMRKHAVIIHFVTGSYRQCARASTDAHGARRRSAVCAIHAQGHQLLNDELTLVQAQRAEGDTTREAPAFEVGDLVWLDSRHLVNRLCPAKKLDSKRLGPFKILEIIAPSSPYSLQRPPTRFLASDLVHRRQSQSIKSGNKFGKSTRSTPRDSERSTEASRYNTWLSTPDSNLNGNHGRTSCTGADQAVADYHAKETQGRRPCVEFNVRTPPHSW